VMALGPWAEGRPDLLNCQSALFPISGKFACWQLGAEKHSAAMVELGLKVKGK